MTCRNHPERPAAALCEKHLTGLCRECLDRDPLCTDPTVYCKFRSHCIINELMKERKREFRVALAD